MPSRARFLNESKPNRGRGRFFSVVFRLAIAKTGELGYVRRLETRWAFDRTNRTGSR